ncbi:MAG: metallophosphoesterase [Armatimonadota bacterium]
MNWLIPGAAIAIFVAIVVTRLLMARTGRTVRTTHLRITVPDLPETVGRVRIALLSDLHVGALHVPFDALAEAVDAVCPDVLLLGGDYSAGVTTHPEALALIRLLSDGRPTFGVMGNTDRYQQLDEDALGEILRAGGGDLLVNEVGRVRVGNTRVEVLGVDDPLHGGDDISATLAAASDDADIRIGLCHSPALWREVQRLDAVITVFGHTHGGQVRIPLVEAPVTHLTYPTELAAGLFRYDHPGARPRRLVDHWEIVSRSESMRVSTADGPLMYVTRGVGMSPAPVRVFCPPELVYMDIEPEQSDGVDGDDE